MSKAEELAVFCDRASGHMSRLIRLTGQGDGENWLTDIADELRRLAQVEAEHAELLKAISDAVPVAYHRLIDGPYGDVWTVDSGIAKVKAYRPLYTLEGIRK